ncbi:MAG: DUF92 domain-containing protein [Candidatus Hodarchaeota archaeon]
MVLLEKLITFFFQMTLLAILFNLPILFIIFKKKYLTIPNGLSIAAGLGILFFIIQPFFWLAMIVFFFSSSLLSKFKVEEKSQVTKDFEKGSTKRDAMQVVANGLIPLLFVGGYAISEMLPNFLESDVIVYNPYSPFFIGVFTAFAVHNADTWATEIGILSKRTPRLITNLNLKVPPGTSGGVTTDGFLASILGGLLMGLVYLVATILLSPSLILFDRVITNIILIMVGGFIGSILDSIEGATIQGIFYCNHCNKETESNPHPRCGNTTTLKRGNIWINNDFVNLSSALLVSMIIFLFISVI